MTSNAFGMPKKAFATLCRKAAKLIDDTGWCTGAYFSLGASGVVAHCIVGAILSADQGETCPTLGPCLAKLTPALECVANAYNGPEPATDKKTDFQPSVLYALNDSGIIDAKGVTAILRRAAEAAEHGWDGRTKLGDDDHKRTRRKVSQYVSVDQRAYDVMCAHLIGMTDGRSATGSGACRYRGEDGKKCAVGALIADADYRPSFEGNRVGMPEVLNAVKKSYPITHLITLDDAQAVHDAAHNWSGGKLTDKAIVDLRGIGVRAGLNTHIVDAELKRRGCDPK